MDPIKVAIRVRPFNKEEIKNKSKLIVTMNNNVVKLIDKTFLFDYCYWSHDKYIEKNGEFVGTDSKYTSQQDVMNDLGYYILDNAFSGINCSLFAYGQTGSGKSYSIMGNKHNEGVVPRMCKELFKRLNKNDFVEISMLEIYNEKIYDLFSYSEPLKHRIINNSIKVENLTKHKMKNYDEFELLLKKCNENRTIKETKMNKTSSRAHTIISIKLTTKKDSLKFMSKINFIDLAGSERLKSENKKIIFKEGININKSLSALGNVISKLYDNMKSKNEIHIPYRDSVLTSFLQDTLGGNSKTIMLATISPSNYNESLSTLRYAERVKKIKNNIKVNQEIDVTFEMEEKNVCHPHLLHIYNQSELSECVTYILKKDVTTVGCKNVDIKLPGIYINEQHATLLKENNDVYVVPIKQSNVMINDKITLVKTKLKHDDFIIFGDIKFKYQNPT